MMTLTFYDPIARSVGDMMKLLSHLKDDKRKTNTNRHTSIRMNGCELYQFALAFASDING